RFNRDKIQRRKMTEHNKRLCSIDGCHKQSRARGWCIMHYKRWKRNGDPEPVSYVKTETPEEAFALRTEWQGDCLIWTGSKTKEGYGRIKFNGRVQRAHRYAWERVNGPIPDGMFIVRKDHCSTSCVNSDHLRLATVAQNASHRNGAGKGSKSGIRNVYPHRSKWRVQVVKEGKQHFFGSYDDLDEAAEVAQAAREELLGAYAGKG